jgi:hypothetical protein
MDGSGGRWQWVLDTICQMVEWSYQPLRFNSVVLRTAPRPNKPAVIIKTLTDGVPIGLLPRLISGAFVLVYQEAVHDSSATRSALVSVLDGWARRMTDSRGDGTWQVGRYRPLRDSLEF